jgi:hypothetical protein
LPSVTELFPEFRPGKVLSVENAHIANHWPLPGTEFCSDVECGWAPVAHASNTSFLGGRDQ